MSRGKLEGISLWLPALLCLATLAIGCGSSQTIDVGAIRVTVTAIGRNFDPDGYTILVTGNGENQSQAVDVNGQVLFGVPAGRYVVELRDQADNCVTDLNPQAVNVSSGDTAELLFNTLCA